MNDSVTALKNKHLIYPSSSWMYKLSIAIAKQGVWSLSFTMEVFSLQDMSPITSSRPCKNNSEQLWYCQTNRKHFSQGYKLFQNEKNVLYTLCWTISYFSNHAITCICNKDVFILYLWLLWSKVSCVFV